jgi:HSP20 family protein
MTSLIRYYSPFDRVFDRAFGSLLPALNGDSGKNGRTLKLDVVETPEAYVVKAEVPGVAKDRIDVKVEDRDVTIGVEFPEEVEANGKPLWQERSYGKATRAIRLPESVDANAAQAKHVDGVLQLTLPKVARTNSRQITIQ